MFPDSAVAKGDKSAKATISPEVHAMAEMMRGILYWVPGVRHTGAESRE